MDLTTVQAWFSNLGLLQWGGIALVLFGLYLGRNDIAAMLGKVLPTPKQPVDDHGDRAAQLARLAQAYDWFEHEKCPEGMAVIQQALPHVMHVHPPAVPPVA